MMAIPRRVREETRQQTAFERFHRHRREPKAKAPTGHGPCPVCGAPTLKRRNPFRGAEFWGCSTFPACPGTRHS